MSVGKTDTIISKKDTQKTSDAQPAFATTARRVSVQYRISKTETEKQAQPRIQISVFKRKRFISSCRISICRSGCKRLRSFSRRSGSIAARSRTSLSCVLYLEYLLKPMPTAMSAEMVQTVMSVPEIIRKRRTPNPPSQLRRGRRPTSNIEFDLANSRDLAGGGILNPMRIVFSFLPTEMMPGRRRLRCYPRWVVIWTEADAAAVRLRDCADGQQKRARHDGDDQFHNRSFLRCSRAAGR